MLLVIKEKYRNPGDTSETFVAKMAPMKSQMASVKLGLEFNFGSEPSHTTHMYVGY